MDPSPARPQFQVIPAETLTLLSYTDPRVTLLTIPIFLHPHPLSLWGFFQAHLSAGTQSPCSASLSCREGPGNTYVPPKSLTRGLWCLRRNLMRKTLHTMHRGSLRYVVIEFYRQQSVFNHVCSFGTSGQQQHHRPTRKARSQLGAGHAGCTWQAQVGTAGLPQSVCMNHSTQLCGGTFYSGVALETVQSMPASGEMHTASRTLLS